MHKFTHTICEGCWDKKNPGRQALRVSANYTEAEPCCFCGKQTNAGIFVREDPQNTICAKV